MPARTFAAYTLGIFGTAYFAGMGLSYLIDEDEGVENYRYAVDSIVRGQDGGLQGRIRDAQIDVAVYLSHKAVDFVDDLEYVGSALFMHGKHLARKAYDRGLESLDRRTNDLPM
jgi:hypothetical protein